MDSSAVVIAIVSFLTAVFTLMAGFGLGTILTPVFLFFYDVKIAILIVAVVHLANNLLKLTLFHVYVDWNLMKRFGIATIAGAFAGAFFQGSFGSSSVKVVLGLVLVFLGLQEMTGLGERYRLPKKIDIVGGFLSGFLGGFAGNQGAIRSAYLLNYPLSKETFIATAAVIASVVDVTRIPVYIFHNSDVILTHGIPIGIATASAFGGTIVGKKTMRKVPQRMFRRYVSLGVALIGILLVVRVI